MTAAPEIVLPGERRHGATERRGWMYTAHFDLAEAPFTLTPDTRFFYAHDYCQVALNTLMVAIRSGEGFTKVVGEVGSGKTLLCRMLLDSLGTDYLVAYIPNPYLEPMTLLLAIADELGIGYPADVNQHQILKALTRFLVKSYGRDKKTVVVCLDEAHAMPTETLEALRLLSNLETQRRKLIQLVLFGQPELDERLARPAVRQLKQRISFSCALGPLDRQGVDYYVSHRLCIAGYRGVQLFAPGAVRLLYRASGGVPRLINILAHKALMSAYGAGDRLVARRHMRRAIQDTEAVGRGFIRRQLSKYAPALLGTVLVSVGTALWGGW